MSRLSEIFQAEQGCFIPYVVAGFPDLETSQETILALAGAGAAIIEVGIPFSDPVADGPVIQKASALALKNGYTMDDYLKLISAVRKRSSVGLVMMSYYNPVLQYGLEQFEADAAAAGLDGVLLSDLTPDEYSRMRPFKQLDPIFLAAPTSSDSRLRVISSQARGFIYVISRTGVTGESTDFSLGLKQTVERVRKHSDLPLAVGFGITSAEDVEAVLSVADGAVVGSAIVKYMIENAGSNSLASDTAQFARERFLPNKSGVEL